MVVYESRLGPIHFNLYDLLVVAMGPRSSTTLRVHPKFRFYGLLFWARGPIRVHCVRPSGYCGSKFCSFPKLENTYVCSSKHDWTSIWKYGILSIGLKFLSKLNLGLA